MAIYEESPSSRRYWEKYVETPCNAVHTRGESINDYLDFDCQIAASPSEHIATGGMAFNNSGIMPPPQQPAVTKPPKVKAEPRIPAPPGDGNPGFAKKDQAGNFTHNKKGVKLCTAYNSNKCKGKCPHGAPHQCNKCLQNSHTAAICGQTIPNFKKTGKKNGKD